MKDKQDSELIVDNLVAFAASYIGHLSQEEQKDILSRIQFEVYKKGELIYSQGQIPRKVCFLTEGSARFFYLTKDGKEHTTNFGFENEPVVPYGSFVEQSPSGVSVAALSSVQVAWASLEDFNGILNKHPRFQAGIAKLLGEYLIKGSQQLSLLRIGSARERYDKLGDLQPKVIRQVPLTYVASYLDMALGTLSRVRAGKL